MSRACGCKRSRETGASAVLVTPAHQFPTGCVLSRERRAALIEWAEDGERLIVEDDFDAEYRYDRVAVGALQGLAPERVLYIGSASKRLAPGMRLGWMLLPSWLAWQLISAKAIEDGGSEVVGQLALCDFIARGELDRHVRRMRLRYQQRRRGANGGTGTLAAAGVPRARPPASTSCACCPRTWTSRRCCGRREPGVGVEGLALHRFTTAALQACCSASATSRSLRSSRRAPARQALDEAVRGESNWSWGPPKWTFTARDPSHIVRVVAARSGQRSS